MHMEIITEVIGQMWHYLGYQGIRHRMTYPLIVMSPSVAKAIAADGWSKDDVRRYLREHMRITAQQATDYARSTSTPTFDLHAYVRQGILPAEYALSDDPQRSLPMIIDTSMVGLLIAGDPGRNQSRGYMSNHIQGPPVSRRVELPRQWSRLMAEVRS